MFWRPKIVQISVIARDIYKLFPAFQMFSVTDVQRETHNAISFIELIDKKSNSLWLKILQ